MALLYFSWQIWNATECFSQFTLSGPKICWKSRNFFLFFPKCTESGTYFNFFCKFSLQSFPVCYEKLGNHFLGVKCPKNPSLKCQIFKTFPFLGERNKDKYLPLKIEEIEVSKKIITTFFDGNFWDFFFNVTKNDDRNRANIWMQDLKSESIYRELNFQIHT